MQLKIRKPVTIEVTEIDAFSFGLHFISAGKHTATVAVPRELLPKLIADLKTIVPPADAPREDNERRSLLQMLSGGITRAA